MFPEVSRLYLIFSALFFVSPMEISSSHIMPTINTSDDCQSWGYINNMALNVSLSHDYVKGSYVCKQFARELLDRLVKHGCSAQLVTGYYGNPGEFRGWHRWVQTPYFNLEATPEAGGIISNMSLYHRSYVSPVNFSYEWG